MAQGTLETFTDANFDQEVRSHILVLVYFWASWCGPCQILDPEIDALAKKFSGEVKFGKIDVDNNPDSYGKCHLNEIPAVVLFKDGEVLDKLDGRVSDGKIREMLEDGVRKFL